MGQGEFKRQEERDKSEEKDVKGTMSDYMKEIESEKNKNGGNVERCLWERKVSIMTVTKSEAWDKEYPELVEKRINGEITLEEMEQIISKKNGASVNFSQCMTDLWKGELYPLRKAE